MDNKLREIKQKDIIELPYKQPKYSAFSSPAFTFQVFYRGEDGFIRCAEFCNECVADAFISTIKGEEK